MEHTHTVKMASIAEAVLFACGEPVPSERIAEVLGIDARELPDIMDCLNKRYEEAGSGLRAKPLGKSWQLCTEKEFAPYIRAAMENKKSAPLSNAAMEVLTIVAYNQPVTKSFIEHVRGIDSSSVVNTLVERELLEEAGRLEIPGRPIAYRTTENFLRCFELSSLGDLPPLPILQPPGAEADISEKNTPENTSEGE
ncbi:MAG: SMC-Scp complex subunit ScpB [Oscillospiraceae bacterium]|nr:SMC-Scp complex subunit ScpB [Oscillospiraceae bacterium]